MKSYFHLGLLVTLAMSLAACASFKADKKYSTAPIAAPSVAPIKGSIAEANQASAETSRQIAAFKRGANTVDYKASRALLYFP